LVYIGLKKRIKKNEGFSNKPYKDILGNTTIGYGHLIKKNENFSYKNKLTKKSLTTIFNSDFNIALKNYKKKLYKKYHNNKDKELIIEMIFQLGIKNVENFKKMIFNLNQKNRHMVALEMMNSLWYKQTPKRVEDLIKNYLKQ